LYMRNDRNVSVRYALASASDASASMMPIVLHPSG
jgi:hypothetical protein